MATSKLTENNFSQLRLTKTEMDSPSNDINILFLGETGVGKTTFINSFVNYLCYNKLDTALNGEMQVLIPASFFVTDPDTFESTTISIGPESKNEIFSEKGESNTQDCQSYVFSIGTRKLRLIDAPGMGDTRGVTQDAKNFDHILKFISRYDHLNGICILLKPNEQRINILFRFCIKELLTHLHVTAKENIIFVFTNARSTFYLPGTTAPLLKGLLKELRENTGVDVPFVKDNTFSFDNESFRFLATYKRGMRFTPEQTQDFSRSWDVSVNEFACLVSRIVTCKAHAVRDTVSLNEAQQLIRKLTRPIGEIATLIQENIQLAQRHKHNLLNKPPSIPDRMPQKNATIVFLDHPRTVCTSDECTRVVMVDGEQKVDYPSRCHAHCHLKGVEQEVIRNPILKHCAAMNKLTGKSGMWL
jgi:GTP-binding protein EngB required for normal cell division